MAKTTQAQIDSAVFQQNLTIQELRELVKEMQADCMQFSKFASNTNLFHSVIEKYNMIEKDKSTAKYIRTHHRYESETLELIPRIVRVYEHHSFCYNQCKTLCEKYKTNWDDKMKAAESQIEKLWRTWLLA